MTRLVHGTLVVILFGAAAIVGAAPAGGAPPPTEVTFTTPGTVHQYTVPAHVYHVAIEACGASGGRSTVFSNPAAAGLGGTGGRARSTIDVTPGEVLQIRVGGVGANSPGGGAAPGGANGGGTGQNGSGGGGGASDVRRGGDTLGHRVVVGGGGGGGGHLIAFTFPVSEHALPGGHGGGAAGGNGDAGATGATQSGPGTNSQDPARNGSLGAGGNGGSPVGEGGGGGGGGLFGGAAGRNMAIEAIYLGAGAGGSGLGVELSAGACTAGAYVSLTSSPRSILPGGVLVAEGDGSYEVALLPVHLSEPAEEAVSVQWSTGTLPLQPGYARAGQDFVAASGVVTFSPGETTAYVPITFTDDNADEPDLLWGEWGVVLFSNPTGAVLDTTGFFGAGLFIIVDDD